MSIGRRLKQPRGKDPKATRTPRSTNKRSKEARAEELSPEQRVEFAQQIEAKEFRGRPAPRRRRGRVRAYSASEYRGSAARHAASGSPNSLRTMFVPSTIATILYCAWRRLMPSRPIPQSEEITIARAGCASAPRGRCRRPGPSVPRTEDGVFETVPFDHSGTSRPPQRPTFSREGPRVRIPLAPAGSRSVRTGDIGNGTYLRHG